MNNTATKTLRSQMIADLTDGAITIEQIGDVFHSAIRQHVRAQMDAEFQAIAAWHHDNGSADPAAEALAAMTKNLLVRGANDTWSGRDNDTRRVEFDARREWITSPHRWDYSAM